MPVTRADVADALAMHDAAPLRAILDAAGVSPRGAEAPQELAARIADALWWSYCTPLGYVASRTSLDDIVVHVGRKVGKRDALTAADAWGKLQDLTLALVRELGPVAFSDLDPQVRERLWPSWVPPALYGVSAGGSLGASAVGKLIVRLGATPIGRVLPLLPTVGPWFKVIRTGAGAAATVGGPLAVALGVLSVNSALGTNYAQLVPLLLGVGALGPQPVEDAQEVVDPVEAAEPEPTADADLAAPEEAEEAAEPEPTVDADLAAPEEAEEADEAEEAEEADEADEAEDAEELILAAPAVVVVPADDAPTDSPAVATEAAPLDHADELASDEPGADGSSDAVAEAEPPAPSTESAPPAAEAAATDDGDGDPLT